MGNELVLKNGMVIERENGVKMLILTDVEGIYGGSATIGIDINGKYWHSGVQREVDNEKIVEAWMPGEYAFNSLSKYCDSDTVVWESTHELDKVTKEIEELQKKLKELEVKKKRLVLK